MNGILIFAITSLIFITGCTKEDNAVVAPVRHTITIEGLPETLSAPEGYPQEMPFMIRVSNADGTSIRDETVSLSVTRGNATVVPTELVTESDGIAEAIVKLDMPSEDGRISIQATTGSGAVTATVRLAPTARPAELRLLADYTELTVVDDQNARIELTAVVTDADGVVVSGVDVEFSLQPIVEEDEVFGSLSTPTPTNQNGETQVIFSTLTGYGNVIVRAVHELPGGDSLRLVEEIVLEVSHLSQVVGTFTLNASPSFIVANPPDTTVTSTLTATVVDLNGVAIEGLQIEYETDFGSISEATMTDMNGRSTALFSLYPPDDYPDPEDDRLECTVSATISGTSLQETTGITVERNSCLPATLTVIADGDTIYADMGVTVATLSLWLRCAHGEGIPGVEIIVTSNHGAVNSPIMTDSNGFAGVVFSDIGLPSEDENGNPVPAIIFIRVGGYGIERMVEIYILERSEISLISLQAAASQMIAGRGDSMEVTATCIQENGERAADGTLVTFTTQIGRMSPDQVDVTGGIGAARAFYITGQRSGTDRLQAYVVNQDGDTTYSNEVVIEILPDSRTLSITVVPDVIVIGSPAEITITVTDGYQNPIPGLLISLTTNGGRIAPDQVVTDEDGVAILTLYPADTPGFYQIFVTIGGPPGTITAQTTFQLIRLTANSIQLTAERRETQPGSENSVVLTATIRDENGDVFTLPAMIVFELIDPPWEPGGGNINQHGPIDSAFVQNGIAQVGFNPGNESGIVTIKAYTWRDQETRLEEIYATEQILVTGGPPHSIDMDVSNEGEDGGGGTWQVELSARVYDEYRNPVADNIPVSFTVEPDIATIDPGSTGNENLNGESFPGLAFSLVTYNSDNTFDTLEITAIIEAEDGQLTRSIEYTLPLQGGELQLNVSLDEYHFEDEEDQVIIRCSTILQDGHEIRISNAPVLYSTTVGNFYWLDDEDNFHRFEGPTPVIAYTPEAVYLIGVADDFFLDPFAEERTLEVNAEVVGYNEVEAEPQIITLTR